MALAVLIIWAIFMTFVLCYTFSQFTLLVRYLRNRKEDKVVDEPKEWPHVTVQLPVFNELYVVERLIECVSQFDYPIDKLEIQVLDDSTDESFEVAARKVQEVAGRGIDIVHIKRPDRVGFKAGALAYGTDIAKGEFIAIFDADFLPPTDFLKKTIPHFTSEDIGVVQTRWGHINREYSLLTRLQALALDAHFRIEQRGRNAGGHFINFNGTAGVWRKACIEDAGGWQSDTLTEDLDLSYRAQLRGWKFEYLEDVESPAELPVQMGAVKTQQFRWTKGAAECAVKNMPRLFRARGLSFSTRAHGFFHLMNSFIFICVLMLALLSIPIMMVEAYSAEYQYLFKYANIFGLSLLFVLSIYVVSAFRSGLKPMEFLVRFPLFLCVVMGLSLHNGIGVLEGYFGRKTPFIRTPKFNIVGVGESWSGNKYLSKRISGVTLLEGLVTLYFVVGIIAAVMLHAYMTIPFMVMLAFGFGYVFYLSVRHAASVS